MSRTHPKIARIFVECRGNREIAYQVLARDTRNGCSKSLPKCDGVGSVLRVGIGDLGKAGVINARAYRNRADGFLDEIVPFLVHRHSRYRVVFGNYHRRTGRLLRRILPEGRG